MMTVPIRSSAWRKSSHSDGHDTCVEIHHDLAAVRDTKNRTGPVLRGNLVALVAAVKDDAITR
jgi:hypothetical protein